MTTLDKLFQHPADRRASERRARETHEHTEARAWDLSLRQGLTEREAWRAVAPREGD
jgi:hypothetical protein